VVIDRRFNLVDALSVAHLVFAARRLILLG
jgi:hypothetical protein